MRADGSRTGLGASVPGDDRARIDVGFVLARYPVLSETFILRELYQLWSTGTRIAIYAFGASPDSVVHPMVEALHVPVIILPERLRRLHIARALIFWAAKAPARLARSLRGTGGPEAFHAAMGAIYLAWRARLHRPRHLHAHYLCAPAAAARTMAILHGVTFSATAHAHDIFLSDSTELGMRIRQAAWVRTISHYNRRILRGFAPELPPRRIQVIRIGIDLDAYPYRPPDPCPRVVRITTVGRLVDIKGVDVLLNAVALLPPDRWRLSVIGGGPLDSSLRGLCTRLGISDRVRFEGPLVQEAVREALGHTDLFVLAAQRDSAGNMDGLPVVLIEALASGIPSISTMVSGIPELLGAGAGLLVPPRDPRALAAAMIRLMDDAELRLRVSERGRRKVERWWDLTRRCGDLARRFASLGRSGLDGKPPAR